MAWQYGMLFAGHTDEAFLQIEAVTISSNFHQQTAEVKICEAGVEPQPWTFRP